MATNFLEKSLRAEKIEETLFKSLKRILDENKLPRLVDLMILASPSFKDDEIKQRINGALVVLKFCCGNKEYLLDSLNGGQSVRVKRFGIQWELPVRIAYGIICDLENGVDVFNPSASDLRSSVLFKQTVKRYVPEGMSSNEFNKISDKLVEDMISDTQLAPEKDEKPFREWSEEEIIANLHPMLIKRCKEARKFNSSEVLDYYETLSEVVKAFPDKKVWKKKSWSERQHIVPELRFIGLRGCVQIEEDYLKLSL